MTYYDPVIVGDNGNFRKQYFNKTVEEVTTGLIDMNMNELFLVSKFEPFFIYDIPEDIYICISDKYIPWSVFDYLNPLLISPHTIKALQFYQRNSNISVKTLECRCILSPYNDSINDILLRKMMYYPPKYSIDYSSMVVCIKTTNIQICDLFDDENLRYKFDQTPFTNFLHSMSNVTDPDGESPNLINLLQSIVRSLPDSSEDESGNNIPGLEDPDLSNGGIPYDGQAF